MEDVITLIDKIVEEHKMVTRTVQTLEQAANDTKAAVELEKGKESFMPGRIEQRQGLQRLQELLETIAPSLQEHFNMEETRLLAAFEKYADKELVSALHFLLVDHEELRNRLARLRELVTELDSKKLSRQVWEAKAYDMRAYVSHTRKLLEAHAETELSLLQKLRSELAGREKGNN